jgi:N-succinyldiaminopimelate aminotransferase
MPRFAALDSKAMGLGGSVFSALASRIAALRGEVYPFHIGDTWMNPHPSVQWQGLDRELDPAPHRYANPNGLGPLLEALVSKLRQRNRLAVSGTDELLVTPGATGALHAIATATVSAGDEVLLLAPYWPLIRGIVVMAGATPVEVPVLHAPITPEALAQEVQARITERTAAVYVSTPGNPTGGVLSAAHLQAVAEVAARNDLWIWSDEVYEEFSFDEPHVSIGEFAPERTCTAFSFSKAYGVTGYRVGYVAGPRAAVAHARKGTTYAWYSVSTPAQWLCLRGLTEARPWVAEARAAYLAAARDTAATLRLPVPAGGTFVFFDLGPHLGAGGMMAFLEDCLEDNLVLAPGSSFGAAYATWVRLCYTAVSPEQTSRGVHKLARRLGIG